MGKELPFGACPAGPVQTFVLADCGLRLETLNLGATIRALWAPDRNGVSRDVLLGYDSAAAYWEQDGCLGGTIGRCANRIAGAAFSLNGRRWTLTANEGENQLHGGKEGFHKKLWDAVCGEKSVTFSRTSPAGEEGYPGTLRVEVTYALRQGAVCIDYRAVSDADTVVSLTNHAYFNLAGQDGGPVGDHVLTVRADRFTPCGAGNIPSGETEDLGGTPLDLRVGAPLSSRLGDPFLAGTRGFDHNYVLSGGDGPCAELYCPRTGIAMDMTATQPGLQVYTAGFLTPRMGKNGVLYGPGHGVCLENEHFPDAIHHADFPSPVLRAGETYRHRIVLRFSTR